MAAQIIPLTSAANQSFNVQLQVDGQPLTLTINIAWSTMAGYWVMDIFDAVGNPLARSVPLITGSYPAANILGQQVYLAIGSAFMLNGGNANADYAGVANLGTDFTLLWSDTPLN
jgi:hypothetical protein